MLTVVPAHNKCSGNAVIKQQLYRWESGFRKLKCPRVSAEARIKA